MGKHEQAAVTAIRSAAALIGEDNIHDAVADVLLAGSLIPALQAGGSLVLALEDAANRYAETAKRLRAALTEAMSMSVPAVNLPHHVMSYVEAKPRPVVTDAAALPPEFLIPQPPKPDLAAIARAVKHGPVAGVAMTNGGAGHIRISTRRENAA